MPIRTYRGTVDPPKWWEKFLSHPFECIVAVMGITFGLMLLAGLIDTSYDPSPPVAELSSRQGWLMALSLLLGSAGVLVAMLAPLPDLEAEWLVERVGLALTGLAWLQYALAVYINDPDYGGALVLGLGLAAGIFSRLAVTFVIQKRLVEILQNRESGEERKNDA